VVSLESPYLILYFKKGKDEFEPVEDVTEQEDQRIGAIDHILDPFWDLPDDDNEVDGGGTPADVECGKLEPTGA